MKKFQSILQYYGECFTLVDVFQFNSRVAQNQYKKPLNIAGTTQIVLPITHEGVQDHREKKQFDSNILRMGFIGHESPYKGLPLLKNVLANIDSSKWRLDVWGGRIGRETSLPIYYRGKFNSRNISQVYAEMDLLVVPSIWQETFSLATLEALSYGVPVLVSKNVGAKDLVEDYNAAFVYNTAEELNKVIESLISDKTPLQNFNQAIRTKLWAHNMIAHAKNVIEKLY